MVILTFKNAKIGMLVKLTNPDPLYNINPSNPATGSQYECEGVVTSAGMTNIRVGWENGQSNNYKNNELSLNEPMLKSNSGYCIDIWPDI